MMIEVDLNGENSRVVGIYVNGDLARRCEGVDGGKERKDKNYNRRITIMIITADICFKQIDNRSIGRLDLHVE